MQINGINNGFKIQLPGLEKPQQKNVNGDFGEVINSFIDDVKKSSNESTKITQDFVTGGDVEVHEVMIASQKAKTDLLLLNEIKNKALETYKELSRMQI